MKPEITFMRKNVMEKMLIKELFKKNKLNLTITVIAAFLVSAGNIVISWLIKEIVDFIAGGSNYSIGILIAVAVCGILTILAAGALDYFFLSKFRANAMHQYRAYVFDCIMKKKIGSFSGEGTSLYISALSNDVNTIEEKFVAPLQNVIQTAVTFAAAVALMIWYSPVLTLITIAFSIIPVIVSLTMGNKAADAEKKVSDKKESYIGLLKDTLTGFSVIKSFKAEENITKEHEEINEAVKSASKGRTKINLLISYSSALAGSLMQLGVFIAAALLSISNESITGGVAIVFVQLINYILSPIQVFPEYFAGVKASKALIDKLARALNTNVSDEGEKLSPNLLDKIEIKDLNFAYEQEKAVLCDINMEFNAGGCYAIVGASGSGKSTLLKLLLNFTHDYEGQISYDGKELKNVSHSSLYDLVSIIQQDVFIFNNTIRNNITMFKSFPEEDIERAIRLSGLKNLIDRKGEEYLCGENGSLLSGGERQRISIARALLRKTPVLLVDEATASLDAETSLEVMRAILNLEGFTRIIVTHDLDEFVLKRCTELFALKNGVLVEHGTFANLMGEKNYFYSLYNVSQNI